MKKYFFCLLALIIIFTGCRNDSEFIPPDKVKEVSLKGEFVIIEDYYYQMSDMVFKYYRAFITENELLYIIDASYKPSSEGYQMESYTYDNEGIADSYTLYIDEYGIKVKMNEGTLLGVKREDYALKEKDMKIVIIHSGQYAKITGKESNNILDDLPEIPVFKISSDNDIEEK